MPRQVIGRTVSAPEGWTFESAGTLVPRQEFSAATFDALYQWAKDRNYGLEPDLNNAWFTNVSSWAFTCRYKVYIDSFEITEKWLGDGTWKARRGSARRVSIGEAQYITPDGVAYRNQCANCSRMGIATWYVGPPKNDHRLCAACSEPCSTETCKRRVATGVLRTSGSQQDKCHTCVPRVRCKFCTQYVPAEECKQASKGYVCEPCQERYKCRRCDDFPEQVYTLGNETLCVKCYGKAIEDERKPHEKWGTGELPQGRSLKIESLPNRPVRIVSIETEIDGEAIALANTLYNEGLVREAFVESYGTAVPDQLNWPAFLKHDGSVTAGELISYLLQLDNEDHAKNLLNVLAKLRSLEKTGKIRYGHTCGGHIHIDAHNFSSDNIWRLLTGYNYLEDVIFRLAGAGHEHGHRTLVPGHDAPNGGRGYSHPTAKGPWGIKSGAYRAAQNQDRMTGLNFQPYLNAVSYCSCGAGVENLRSCTCTLPKCTVEWRVWNSTGHPRILHGWIAFMQALHAWADTPKEMTTVEEQEYPPLAWVKLPWAQTNDAHKQVALERVEWIFSNLVFTENEKDSLAYAFQQTDIAFPSDFWPRVARIPAPTSRRVVRPRNCITRADKICIQKPTRKVYGDAKRDPLYLADRQRRRERDSLADHRRLRATFVTASYGSRPRGIR